MLQRTLSLLVLIGWGVLPAQGQTTSAPSRDTRTITVTGCLTKGVQPGSYLLTKVPDRLVDAMAVTATGVIPTVTYQLTGGKDLMGHVGHKLEVTGKTSTERVPAVKVETAEVTHEPTAEKPASKVETKEKAEVSVRPLAVESVRAVMGTCDQK